MPFSFFVLCYTYLGSDVQMIKKGIITTLLILSSFFFLQVVNAEVVTETLKEILTEKHRNPTA